MTTTEREMALGAVALSKEHADRADAAEARWTALREEIRQERAAQDEIAAEHAEWGRDGQSVSCYGRVKALDWVLATMDRMEAGQ